MEKLVHATLHSMSQCGVVGMAVLLLFMRAHADAHGDLTNQFNTKDTSSQALNLRQDMKLSEYIWNGALDLLPKVWNTTFVNGVAKGNMNPNFYGNYVLQDAVYCRMVAQLWVQLANNASVDEKIRDYANSSANSVYQKTSISVFDEWNVKDDGEDDFGVIVRKPVMEYVTFIEDTMLAYPPNVMIATYACLQLWDNLTGDLLLIVENSTSNPYDVWVYENHENGSISNRRQAAKMDEWDKKYQWYDWSEALSLFRIAVINEINFFEHAGNFAESARLYTKQYSKPLPSRKMKYEIT